MEPSHWRYIFSNKGSRKIFGRSKVLEGFRHFVNRKRLPRCKRKQAQKYSQQQQHKKFEMLEMLLLHSDQEPVPMTHSDWFPGEYNMITWPLYPCAETVRKKLQCSLVSCAIIYPCNWCKDFRELFLYLTLLQIKLPGKQLLS